MHAVVLPWAGLHSAAGLSSSSNLAKLPLQPSTRTPAQRQQSGKICQQFICAHLHTTTRAAAGAECWLYSKWGNLEIIIIIMIRLHTSSRHETRSLGRSGATNCIRIYSPFIMGGRTPLSCPWQQSSKPWVCLTQVVISVQNWGPKLCPSVLSKLWPIANSRHGTSAAPDLYQSSQSVVQGSMESNLRESLKINSRLQWSIPGVTLSPVWVSTVYLLLIYNVSMKCCIILL